MGEDRWVGEMVLVVFREEGIEKRARGILREVTGQFFEIQTEKNNLLIAKDSIIKVKFGRGGDDGGI